MKSYLIRFPSKCKKMKVKPIHLQIILGQIVTNMKDQAQSRSLEGQKELQRNK